jgi:hypothetical protein
MPQSSPYAMAAVLVLVWFFRIKDDNGAGSDRVEYLGTQNRNPNLEPKSAPNTDSDENPSPKLKPADPRNSRILQ